MVLEVTLAVYQGAYCEIVFVLARLCADVVRVCVSLVYLSQTGEVASTWS